MAALSGNFIFFQGSEKFCLTRDLRKIALFATFFAVNEVGSRKAKKKKSRERKRISRLFDTLN